MIGALFRILTGSYFSNLSPRLCSHSTARIFDWLKIRLFRCTIA